MTEVMIQEKEDAAAWLSTLHGEELMQEAAVQIGRASCRERV